MNEIAKKKKRFYKKKWFWIIVLAAMITATAVFTRGGEQVPEFSSAVVERKDLRQTVSETGSVIADLEVRYGWEMSGRVASIEKQVGDMVAEGDVIAAIDDAKQRATVKEARSGLAGALAKLNLELAGPSEDQERQSWASVEQARASLVEAKANLEKAKAKAESDIVTAQKALQTAQNDLQLAEGGDNSQLVNDAYEDLVNALKSALTNMTRALTESDNILGIDNTVANDDFEIYLSILDSSYLNRAELSYLKSKTARGRAIDVVMPLTLSSENSVIDDAAFEMQNALTTLQSHLLDVQLMLVQATVPTGELSESELDTLKTNITTQQTSVDSSATNVANMRQATAVARNSLFSYQIAYDKAVLALETTRRQANADVQIAEAAVLTREAIAREKEAAHNQLVNPPRAVDVASLRADVARQSATIESLQDDLDKTKLVALASGVLATLDIEIGENVSANQEIMSIVSSQLTVEVDISESDIAKVSIDDPVSLTLDAFGEDRVFTGTVASVDPAQTEISGVIYYKTKVFIDLTDGEMIRPGMTANVDIMTDTREGVLVIPRRAILERGSQRFVRVLIDPKTAEYEEREVQTGLRGDDGEIEVTSGLGEGEEIITFIREEE
jgi:HlyD family secretion protein